MGCGKHRIEKWAYEGPLQYLHEKLEGMRAIALILVLILIQNVSFSQEEGFPGVPYTKVLAYMLNTKKSSARPDHRIWSKDKYAFSKMGDGVELNEKQVEALTKITSYSFLKKIKDARPDLEVHVEGRMSFVENASRFILDD